MHSVFFSVLEETKKKCGLVNPIACVLVCRPYEYDKEYAKVKDAKAQGVNFVYSATLLLWNHNKVEFVINACEIVSPTIRHL